VLPKYTQLADKGFNRDKVTSNNGKEEKFMLSFTGLVYCANQNVAFRHGWVDHNTHVRTNEHDAIRLTLTLNQALQPDVLGISSVSRLKR
jgi:hypothetical protein